MAAKLRILIAEDDSFSERILRLILENSGEYEVVSARNGEEAWMHLEASPAFALCLFDVMMPVLDGLQLTRRMRADPRFQAMPVIFVTALHDRPTVDAAAELEVSHYMVKPISKEDVLERVDELCVRPTTARPDEPPPAVTQRLGLSPEQLREFRRDLAGECLQLCARLQTARKLSASDILDLNARSGAACNLGNHRLSAALSAVEAVGERTPAERRLRQLLHHLEVIADSLRREAADPHPDV